MKTLVLLGAAFALAGCGTKPAETPPEDPKIAKFKEAVAHYLSEARAGAKLLEAAPGLAEATQLEESIRKLHARLPDVPPEVDATGQLAARLKDISVSFSVGTFHVQLASKALRQGMHDFAKGEYEKSLPDLAKKIRYLASEVEGVTRLP